MAIGNKDELEFCIFLINSLAERLGLLTPDVYKMLNFLVEFLQRSKY